MNTKTIRKRHEIFIHGSQVKYLVLTIVAVAVIIAMIVVIAFMFDGIVS